MKQKILHFSILAFALSATSYSYAKTVSNTIDHNFKHKVVQSDNHAPQKALKKKIKLVVSHSSHPKANQILQQSTKHKIILSSASYGMFDLSKNSFVENHKVEDVRPIASLTKLMTANVFIKNMPQYCFATIDKQDLDTLKNTHSRLPQGEKISCAKLLNAMLVSSDNTAAFALSRSLPNISRDKFVDMMNIQAKKWNMTNTHFADPTGLDPKNVSTVSDLAILAKNSLEQPLIKQITSQPMTVLVKEDGKILYFKNSNRLVRELGYETDLSKTGYIRESGYNLIYKPKHECENQQLIFISLGSSNSLERSQFAQDKMKQYHCSAV